MSEADILPEELGAATGLGSGDLRITIARIIRAVFGFLGIVAVLIILYAGFIWMTAAGNPERVDKAKKILSAAIIGLIIILSAFGIASFIIRVLLGELEGLGGAGGPPSSQQDAVCIGLSATCPAGALGNGIIESHYPTRNANGVPRNTRIVITFKEEIQPESIILGGLNGTVAILKSAEVSAASNQFPQKFAAAATADRFEVAFSEDGRTVAFTQKNCPDQCLGSATENVFYTVGLRGGAAGVKLSDGTQAFTGTFNNGYLWEFQTSTKLDTEPPKVSSHNPGHQSSDNPRNSMVQVNFNEAVDPTSVKTIRVTYGAGTVVTGEQRVGNGYRTVEFRASDLCGTNSCGEPVYCLPANAAMSVNVKADGLSANPPLGVYPPNGVVDMAGNSLDGDGDGQAEGPTTDDFAFTFSTNNEIDLVPPRIVSHLPDIREGNIARDSKIAGTFSKLMSRTSFNSTTSRLESGAPEAPTNYWMESSDVSAVAGQEPSQTEAVFVHDLLSSNQPYSSKFTSGVRDLRQNCYYPSVSDSACNDPSNDKKFCCDGVPSDAECVF